MDDSFLKRVLSEWFRDRKKEQEQAEIVSFEAIVDLAKNPLILQRLSSVLSLRAIDHEFTRFKKGLSMTK
jgi:hypothetical protein